MPRTRLVAALLAVCLVVCWTGPSTSQTPPRASDEGLSTPAPGPMPVLNALVAPPLVPVVETVAAELRGAGNLDLRIETVTTEALPERLARRAGAPDLVLLEGREAASLLVRLGYVAPDAFVSQASDGLAVAVREEDRERQPLQYLAEITPGRIIIPNPDTTMAGLHAKQALARTGLWEKISFKVRHADSTSQIVRELAAKSVDASVLYLSAIIQMPGLVSILTLPKDSHFPILYLGAPLKTSPRAELARAFLARLASPASRDAWMTSGFQPPPPDLP